MTRFLTAVALTATLASAPARAQTVPTDTTGGVHHGAHDHAAMDHAASDHAGHAMHSAIDARVPMSADASGTARIPAASPLEAAMTQAGAWHLMLHGAVFPRLTAVDVFGSGARGGTALGAPNWLMGMAQRPIGPAALTLRAMLSLDPLTESGDGYRLPFQSGETFEGERLVDRQHPHDWSRSSPRPSLRPLPARRAAQPPLTGRDAHRVGRRDGRRRRRPARARRLALYRRRARRRPGHARPPAVRLLQRPRLAHPDAHNDAPGVARLYQRARIARARREPGPHDGVGRLRRARRPRRRPHGEPRLGRNTFDTPDVEKDGGHGEPQQAFLAEATLRIGRGVVFGRGEWVEKSGEEFALDGMLGEPVYGIGALGLGAGVDVARTAGLALTLGTSATAYRVPEALQPLYGRTPVSAQVFLRLSPRRM